MTHSNSNDAKEIRDALAAGFWIDDTRDPDLDGLDAMLDKLGVRRKVLTVAERQASTEYALSVIRTATR